MNRPLSIIKIQLQFLLALTLPVAAVSLLVLSPIESLAILFGAFVAGGDFILISFSLENLLVGCQNKHSGLIVVGLVLKFIVGGLFLLFTIVFFREFLIQILVGITLAVLALILSAMRYVSISRRHENS